MDDAHPAAAVCLLIVAAAGALLLSTRFGIGVSADSTAYLGFRPHDYGHAPLYSGLMRVAALLPFDIETFARIYHVALFATTTVVSWLLIHRATGRAAPAWAGALLIAFAGQSVRLYSMALSEPTFVLLVVLALWALSSFVQARSPRLFLAAAVAAALATLARYPGAALVATGAVVVLAAGGGGFWRRVGRAAGFAGIGLLPAVAWMAYVARTSGTAGGRQAALAGTADAQTFYAGLLEAARYVLPTEVPVAMRIAALAAVLALLATATTAYYRRVPAPSRTAAPSRARHRYLPLILATFVAFYSAVIVLAVLVEPYLPISDRYLYPVYVALVLLGAVTMPALSRTPGLRRAIAVPVAGFVALSLVRGAKIVTEGFNEGWGYSSQRWRSSPAVRYVNGLPLDAAVYSDDPYALLFLTNHDVRGVPSPIVRRLGAPDPNFASAVAVMQERLAATSGVVVIFERDRGAFDVPTLPALLNAVPLRATDRLGDATVYVLEPERPGVY
jgi:hypothetical protein